MRQSEVTNCRTHLIQPAFRECFSCSLGSGACPRSPLPPRPAAARSYVGQNPGHADRHRPLGLSPGPAFPRLSRGQPASNPEVRPDFCPTYSFQLPALTAALRLAFSAERVGQDLPVHAFGVGRGLEPALADHLELSPAEP